MGKSKEVEDEGELEKLSILYKLKDFKRLSPQPNSSKVIRPAVLRLPDTLPHRNHL